MNAMNIPELMHTLGRQARAAATQMAKAPAAVRARALRRLAALLRAHSGALQAANADDVARAAQSGLAAPMVERLRLTEAILETAAQGCEQLAAMPDGIGEIIGMRQQPSGIRVGQMRVPIGVFGMIYESRPNVTIEAASLSIKSGNACILRGGSEALASNRALAALVRQALQDADLPADAVQLVPTPDRAAVGELIAMPQYVDVIIPRGGKGLIERIAASAKVPVIKHLDGNCHTYVDDPCDVTMAVAVADNAKTQKYSPCNATETLLVAQGVAADFLPRIAAVYAAKGVEMRCDPQALALLQAVQQKNGLRQVNPGDVAINTIANLSGSPAAAGAAAVPNPDASAARPAAAAGAAAPATAVATASIPAANPAAVDTAPPAPRLVPAQEADWFEEYLAPIIAIKIVAGLDEAIAHINHYGSHHTDAIVTTHHLHAQQFLREVDSASVMVNTSTRFADGFEYGLGAEIGISTDKFHARGPVGIDGLTSLKYVVLGQGEVRG